MNPYEVQELFGKAISHVNRREYEPALRLFDRLLIENQNFTPGWNQRGALLAKLNCHFDALTCYSAAIMLSDKEAGLYNNRGVSYLALGYFDRALADFEKASDLDPTIGEVYDNIGIVMRRTGRIEESIDYFAKAIKYKPEYGDAHLGLAMSLLETKQFDEGWKEFEWRWKCGQMEPRKLPYPTWQGERRTDKALLLVSEQGHGDALHFCRYAKLAKEKFGGKVYIEVRMPLGRIMRTIEGIDQVFLLGDKLPGDIAYSIHLLSVPAIVGTEKGFVEPYIEADHHQVARWAGLLKQIPSSGIRVGLCWAGQNREDHPIASAIDQRRSLALLQFAPLAQIRGITWIALQTGTPQAQVKTPPAGMSIVDVSREFEDFLDTAACVANLDLVITADTALVHLAAGMGKPTWMLSRFDGCWRWFGDQAKSPWYPSLRQYRQPKEGDWNSVIEAITRDLQRFVVGKRKEAA